MGFYFRQAEELIYVENDILFLDFEYVSTRFIKNRAKRYIQEIVEIGAIYKSDRGEIEYSSIVKPVYYVKYMNNGNKMITSNKFSKEDILNGVELEAALNYLKNYYEPKETKVITWGRVDYNVLKNICEEYGFKMPFLYDDYIDLSESFKIFYEHKYNLSLDKALNLLSINQKAKHYALEDSKLLIEILYRMLEDGFRFD